MRLPSRRILTLALLVAGASPVRAALIEVPGEVGSLQAALDQAAEGDMIRLAPGTYAAEGLVLRGGVTLAGSGLRPQDTVLSGVWIHPILTLSGDSRPLIIENLTLRDGFALNGGALNVDGADLSLYRVHFLGNAAAEEGGALNATNSRVHLSECLFYANYAQGGNGGAVHIQGDDHSGRAQRIEYCTFAGNAGCCGGTSLLMEDCSLEISNNILEDVNCLPGADATFTCNNGAICGTDGGHNFIADPRYCDFERADCRLEPESPCLPENNVDCGRIGAFDGCEASTATAGSSFSALKSLYR